jgi:ABC-type branched-subunit amino acid transport system substrate-binding protein
MIRNCFFALCCVVVSLSFAAGPVSLENPRVAFKKAEEYYKLARYDSCSAVIRSFLKAHGDDNAAEYLVPLLIESSVREKDYALGQRLFQIYLKKYPASVFMPRLWYLNGIVFSKNGNYSAALSAYSNAFAGGVTPEVDSVALVNVQKICEKALTADELASLSARGDLHQRIIEVLSYYEIVKLFESGQLARVKQKADKYLKMFDRSPHSAAVREYGNKAGDQQRGQVQIGMLVPLSGYNSEIGKQIVQGAQLAFDAYAVASGVKLKVIMCDTRANMIETAKKTKELVYEHRVPIILGPVLSQEAVVAASVLMEKDVVMLSPTANDDGIAGLGPNIFQLNVTLGTLGAKIARYAMDNLNIRDFAIVAPATDYASALSRGFRQEIEKSGREIVAEETYEEGTKDFKAQFDNLKTKLFMRKQQRTAVETSLSGDATSSLKNDPKLPQPDSVFEIGGIFLPAEAEDAAMLAPQIAFHRIKTQMLGSTGWHNPKIILDGKEYVNNALFSSNLPAGAGVEKEWLDFKTQYRGRFGTDPDRIAALGYDAASLIVTALRQAGSSASGPEIARALSAIKGYKGASGPVSFDPAQRINTEASIIKIRDKQFLRVQ